MVKKNKTKNKNQNKVQVKRWSIHEKVFLVLIVTILVLGSLNVAKAKGWLIPEQPELNIVDNIITLDTMTLEQKVAQMVVVHGGTHNMLSWKNMQIGGIHLFALESPELYQDIISQFQQGMQVPFFVTVDYEGCLNPFANFINGTPVSEIDNIGDAFAKGSKDGRLLNELGFSINFAPVVDLNDEIWGCRSFPGNEEEIADLAEAYILGLQSKDMIATAKHYPGQTLVVKDPHKYIVVAKIGKEDIYPYQYLTKKDDVASLMVSHIITTGEIDSKGIPSVVSEELISYLKKDYSGLIISDEINMLGLKDFYPTIEEMYIAVFKAGNDIVLNFNEDPNEVYHMIQVIVGAVDKGIISEDQIDNSVRKILIAKGFNVE